VKRPLRLGDAGAAGDREDEEAESPAPLMDETLLYLYVAFHVPSPP
jgi:hypothetical protein